MPYIQGFPVTCNISPLINESDILQAAFQYASSVNEDYMSMDPVLLLGQNTLNLGCLHMVCFCLWFVALFVLQHSVGEPLPLPTI